MSNTNETSNLVTFGDHNTLADSELDAVTGGAVNQYGDAAYDIMMTKLAGDSGGGNASPANLVRAGIFMAAAIGFGLP